MRKLLYIALLSFGANQLNAQCLPDRHNTSWFDGWISCETSANPNEPRGESHWISYDFGRLYELNELKIWNVNDPDLVSYGAQNVIIDYSLDGINWTEFGQEIFPQAPGISTYEGDIITDFEGIKARYLLLTIADNYGGDCTGFSELRVQADSAKDDNEDICIIADVYPNPFLEQFSVSLQKKCLGDVYIAIEDATGRTVIAEEIIKLYDTRNFGGEAFAPGVYYVCIRNGEIKERYKIVKR
jgi:hypothetical protein